MASNVFYNRIIRKLVVGFGSIFDNITLVRYNPDDTENQRISVPLIYASKEKYIARLVGDPDLDKKVQIVLPRMSFDLIGMKYDGTRKQQTNIKNYSTINPNSTSASSQYVPVPYDFDFELYVYVRSIEDGTQIIEHILPYFTPDYSIKLNLVPSMGITKEVPILLNSVNYDVEFEGERESPVRMVIWTLKFTVKAFLYGPITTVGIIKQAITNIRNLNSLEPDGTTQLSMANTGFGYYKTGEIVYQGFTLDFASAKAEVVAYSNSTNILTVQNITGTFQSNTTIVGSATNAEYSLIGQVYPDQIMSIITQTVSPNTANVNSNYTVITKVVEPGVY